MLLKARKRPFWLALVIMLGIVPLARPLWAEEKPLTLRLESQAFSEGGTIPRQYTCEGDDLSPPVAWTGVPEGAKSLVLIVDDPDAPDPKAPKMTWVHWVLFNLPPEHERPCPGRQGSAGGDDVRHQRLEAAGLWRPLPAYWAPPLCLQALRARYGAHGPEPPQ